jgi:hypothetical protein
MSLSAIENLRTCQRQLDMDGCFVGVSRQALEETLAYIAEHDALAERARIVAWLRGRTGCKILDGAADFVIDDLANDIEAGEL